VRAEANVQPCYLADDVPDAVAAFYRVNDVSRFRLDRPFYTGDKSDGDVKVRISVTLNVVGRFSKFS